MRMRAISRSDAGSELRWYAVVIMRSTMPAISGRSVHTIAASPPGPSGMSIRAIPFIVRPDPPVVQDRSHASAPLLLRDAPLHRSGLGPVPGLRPLDRLRADGEARRRALSRRRAPQRPAATRHLQNAVRPRKFRAQARHRRQAKARLYIHNDLRHA